MKTDSLKYRVSDSGPSFMRSSPRTISSPRDALASTVTCRRYIPCLASARKGGMASSGANLGGVNANRNLLSRPKCVIYALTVARAEGFAFHA